MTHGCTNADYLYDLLNGELNDSEVSPQENYTKLVLELGKALGKLREDLGIEEEWQPLWRGNDIQNHNKGSEYTAEHNQTWCNDKCQVYVYDYPELDGWPPIIEMSLKLNTREPWSDWRDFYRIKSELCGTSCWAIEVYPSQFALVDSANQYHMFCFPPGAVFPIHLKQPPITDYWPEFKALEAQGVKMYGEDQWKILSARVGQRGWEQGHKCDDLPYIGPLWRQRGYYLDEDLEVQKGSPDQDMFTIGDVPTLSGVQLERDLSLREKITSQREEIYSKVV